MAKKIREIEVEYPDCTICGNEIPAGGKFFGLEINLSRRTVGEWGGSSSIGAGNRQHPLIICEKCFSNDDNEGIIKLRIIQELEKQKRELEKN